MGKVTGMFLIVASCVLSLLACSHNGAVPRPYLAPMSSGGGNDGGGGGGGGGGIGM